MLPSVESALNMNTYVADGGCMRTSVYNFNSQSRSQSGGDTLSAVFRQNINANLPQTYVNSRKICERAILRLQNKSC
jgi:hypothetical protein